MGDGTGLLQGRRDRRRKPRLLRVHPKPYRGGYGSGRGYNELDKTLRTVRSSGLHLPQVLLRIPRGDGAQGDGGASQPPDLRRLLGKALHDLRQRGLLLHELRPGYERQRAVDRKGERRQGR